MSVKPIIPSIEDNQNKNAIVPQSTIRSAGVVRPYNLNTPADSVSFQGINPIVSTMDFIEQGGYAASFIIQDGIGFIAPRVGKGLLRGSKQVDENGQPVLDENGKQKRELNWQLARREFLREMITGPSAFLIPMGMFAGIKKWGGSANNIKLNYIEGFKQPFTDFVQQNAQILKDGGNLERAGFYKEVFKETIEQSVNSHLPKGEKLSADAVDKLAQDYAKRQIEIEQLVQEKQYKGFFHRKARAAKIKEIGGTVEDLFMELKKNKIGGSVNEMAIQFRTSQGVKGGSISELTNALGDYFSDAVKNTKKAVGNNFSAENIEQVISNFTKRRMGTRILSNLGIFGSVALFYTQIPKLYNMGIKGNPALKGTAVASQKPESQSATGENGNIQKDSAKKDVAFTGIGSVLEKAGEKTFKNAKLKRLSDIFEFNGNVMSGAAMPVLLYGFCIPPRLAKADDKYDYGEIVFRDLTSFTALLFGAKALSRLFSDATQKLTGLALNQKNMADRNVLQKVGDYLNPLDSRHSVLSTKQLVSKYSNIEQYKGGVNGFVQFIEESGGNIKKALAKDSNIQAATEEILSHYKKISSYADATVTDIKDALKAAHADKDNQLIKKFYSLFHENNGLLSKAKTCNSSFGFLSTIVLIPSLIIWIANTCEKMTARKAEQDLANSRNDEKNEAAAKYLKSKRLPQHIPSMAGFLGNSVR